MYGAASLPLMSPQLWFSITMTKTVWMERNAVTGAAVGDDGPVEGMVVAVGAGEALPPQAARASRMAHAPPIFHTLRPVLMALMVAAAPMFWPPSWAGEYDR